MNPVKAVKTGEELTDAEIDELCRKLFEAAEPIWMILYWAPEELELDEYVSFVQDDVTWMKVESIPSMSAYENICESVFAKPFCEETMYGAELFMDDSEHRLFQRQNFGGGGGGPALFPTEKAIVPISKAAEKLVVRINMKDGVFSGDDDNVAWSDGDLTYTVLLQNEYWVFESLYGTDGKVAEK